MRFLVGVLVFAAAAGNELSLSKALAKIQAQDLAGRGDAGTDHQTRTR